MKWFKKIFKKKELIYHLTYYYIEHEPDHIVLKTLDRFGIKNGKLTELKSKKYLVFEYQH